MRRAGPQDGAAEFWVGQAATQSPRKVARTSNRNNTQAAKAILGLTKDDLRGSVGLKKSQP
jgi:hypothetical protein